MKLRNLFISGLSVLGITTMLMTSTVSAGCRHDWDLTGHREITKDISHTIQISVPGGYKYETCTAYETFGAEGYRCRSCGQEKRSLLVL
ncbi:ATP synthase F1, gamma subunit (plasmid) [Clostridium botulinum]|uniref:ATP synthase F1, gamma subunit n=2 Tax=Clostridium botulinum TaxID=1491 RepID=A0A1L7JNL7_CLOBO|nr:ATP synthase F1, gamma subunit [Clostridium botulinum]